MFLFCFATCFYGNKCNYVITVLYQYKMEKTVIVDATMMYTYLGMSRLHHLDFSHYWFVFVDVIHDVLVVSKYRFDCNH